jgi:hypothetical protein
MKINSKIDLSNNRFENSFQNLINRPRKLFLIIFVILLILEISLSSLYLVKRLSSNLPVIDLIERFYVLRPLKFLFGEEYRFPISLEAYYTGENSLPKNAGNLFSVDSLRGYTPRPNTVVSMMNYFWSATNSQGFHITEPDDPRKIYTPSKPSNIFRIIVLGGSTVAGNGSADQFEALPSILQKELRSNYVTNSNAGKKFEVINGGVGGYYSETELLHYMSSLRRLKPDLVISYNGWNDITVLNNIISEIGDNMDNFNSPIHKRNNIILHDYFHFWPTFSRTISLSLEMFRNFLDGFSIVHIPIRVVQKFLSPAEFDEVEQMKQGGKSQHPYSLESVRRYVENMEILFMINRMDGIKSAWFMQPLAGLGKKPPAEFREKDYVKYMQSQIRRRKIFYGAAFPEMLKLSKKYDGQSGLCAASLVDVFDGNPATVYEDSGHLLASGNLIVVERILRELDKCGAISRKP